MRNLFILGLGLLFLIVGCDEPVYTPKPRAFPKITYPERSYTQFDKSYCDMTFTYPTYAEVEQDTLFFDEKPAHPCWFDLNIPAFGAKVHCTYYPINSRKDFEKLRHDTYGLANRHIVKANAIDEIPVKNENGIGGFIFKFSGPTATPYSFFLTDTTDHFINAALYFNSRPRPDSIAPVTKFLEEDLEKMIKTFKFQ